MESGRKRKPLSDCTNSLKLGQQNASSSSTTVKPTKPFLSSTIHRLLANSPPISNADTVSPVFVPSIRSPPSKTSNIVGRGSVELSEPRSVYGRRQSANTKVKSIYAPMAPSATAAATTSRFPRDKVNESVVLGYSKSCTMPQKKKKRQKSTEEDVAEHSLPQDFIEKQRAYFAEIDAFELPEEEVASTDGLE